MGDGYEISIKKLAKQKTDKDMDDMSKASTFGPQPKMPKVTLPKQKDPEITADEPHVISTDTEKGARDYAIHRLARMRADKASEYDEEAGDGDEYMRKRGWHQ